MILHEHALGEYLRVYQTQCPTPDEAALAPTFAMDGPSLYTGTLPCPKNRCSFSPVNWEEFTAVRVSTGVDHAVSPSNRPDESNAPNTARKPRLKPTQPIEKTTPTDPAPVIFPHRTLFPSNLSAVSHHVQ